MKPRKAKPIRAAKMVKIEWMPNCRLGVGFVHDPYNPVGGWLRDIEIGLRSDGVVMWRRASKAKR
jgi:hypothetical protein